MAIHELDGLAPTEQAAAIAVATIVGARARAHDVDGRQGAVDVELVYPNTAVAALEITSHAGDGVRQRDGILAADDNQWEAPGHLTWDIRVSDPQIIPELRARYRRIILELEARGKTNSYGLNPWDVPPLPDDLKWLAVSGLTFWALSQDPSREHVVYVMPEGTGGSIDKRLSGLADAISSVLAEDNQQRHILKLLRSPRDEKHLFVGLHEGAIPFAQAAGLISPDVDLPECAPPELPEGLNHLWLVSTFSHKLVEVHAGQWRLHDLDSLDAASTSGAADVEP